MEGEHTPETDLIRCHQYFEEGFHDLHQDEAQVCHTGGGSNQGEILGSQTRLVGGNFLLGRLCLVCQWQPVWKDLKDLSEDPGYLRSTFLMKR